MNRVKTILSESVRIWNVENFAQNAFDKNVALNSGAIKHIYPRVSVKNNQSSCK